MVSMAPNLGWRDEPLGDRLTTALDLPVPIAFANESDLAALAEHRRGAARGIDDVLLVWGSVGVGGGLIVDGAPLTGSAGYSGEVGHIPVNPDGLPCRCGSTGCWETEVGSSALLRRAGRPPEGGHEAVDAVLAAAGAGDPIALAAFAETGRWLGIGLAGAINVLNPGPRPARRPAGPELPVRPFDPRGRAGSPRPARLPPPRPGRAYFPWRRRSIAWGGGTRIRTIARRSCGLAASPPRPGRPGKRLSHRQHERRSQARSTLAVGERPTVVERG